MAGLLGQIFSAGNVAKRKLTDLLGNPVLSAQQFVGNLNDRARNLNEMTSAAAREGMDYGPATQRLAGLMADAYSPVGMIAPRAEALRIAQKNAAKPIKEGGLGLPPDNTPMDRAKAMGFDTPAYRGTTADEIAGKQRNFVSENPDIANQYAGYLSQFADDPAMLDAMMKLTPNGNVMPILVKNAEKARARTNVPDYEMILDANQARSRFAAFDPARIDENDLLAGVLPLSLLADEEQRKKADAYFRSLLGQ